MKRKLMSLTLGVTATFMCLVLASPICVSASEVYTYAFSSDRDGDNEVYLMDIDGKICRT